MKTKANFRRIGMALLAMAVVELACSFTPPAIPVTLPSLTGLVPTGIAALGTYAPTGIAALATFEPTGIAELGTLMPTIEALGTLAPTFEALATSAAGTPPPPGTPMPAGTGTKFGTPEEAQAMLQQAVDHYNKVGRAQALADFNAEAAPFKYLDLYVACIDSGLRLSANGGFPQYVGGTIQPLSRANWDSATTTSVSSINYAWIDPETHQTLPKTFYYEKVGSDVCGVGAYHP